MAGIHEVVVGTTIACSFILFGNAITQSFMGVPALLVDFPPPSSPDHAARARLLGRQWPTFWKVGNVFFRPISTLGIFGYGYTAWVVSSQDAGSRLGGGDWRLYAASAMCHLITVVHSAINMQPINEKLDALKEPKGQVDNEKAESYARQWIKFNTVRLITPVIAGTLALSQVLRR
ncbi:hypothetical protein SAMD00023353_1700770 [Rosellinia necatrix]|uniref:DUF1772-domain-containing protein n=1 Tax=Rosellinia necatrix TaxID=77044 RepID=A0A1W2TKR7_ROSNE|nr:hypothetical protein SAMD00023353_1700770 [Rosellinia necatrix]